MQVKFAGRIRRSDSQVGVGGSDSDEIGTHRRPTIEHLPALWGGQAARMTTAQVVAVRITLGREGIEPHLGMGVVVRQRHRRVIAASRPRTVPRHAGHRRAWASLARGPGDCELVAKSCRCLLLSTGIGPGESQQARTAVQSLYGQAASPASTPSAGARPCQRSTTQPRSQACSERRRHRRGGQHQHVATLAAVGCDRRVPGDLPRAVPAVW